MLTDRTAPARALVLAAVFLGGAVGTAGRVLLLELVPVAVGAWPWATFWANLLAAALLGVVVARSRPGRSGCWRPFLATGVCGGLSTFATLQLELLGLVEHGAYAVAAAYATLSVLAGLVVVVAATRLTSLLIIRWAAR